MRSEHLAILGTHGIGAMNVGNVDVLIVSGEGAAEASALGLSNKGVRNTNNNNNENVDANVGYSKTAFESKLDVKHGCDC